MDNRTQLLTDNIEKVIVGKHQTVTLAVCALLAMIGLMLARLFYDWIRLPGEKGARIGR